MISEPTVLMVGMPQSGKSTFLAALWYAVRNPDRTSAVVLERLPEQMPFLNELVEDWLHCREATHTSAAMTHDVRLQLRGPNGTVGNFAFPDYSGEYVRDAWVTRRWPGDLAEFVRSASVVMLFVHPHQIREHMTVEGANRNRAALETGPPDPERAAREYDPRLVPTQTQLVDFIQFVQQRSRSRVLPIAMIISAWDVVPRAQLPAEWLAARMPLLHQFLSSNADRLPTAVFGVSAQGDDWKTTQATSLEVEADQRAWIIDMSGNRESDITLPLAWALSAPDR
jgi:hypothetical protein